MALLGLGTTSFPAPSVPFQNGILQEEEEEEGKKSIKNSVL
jgi:hypothetical protein